MRFLVRRLIALSLTLACGMAHARTKTSERIDVDLKKALASPEGQTTQGMVEAYDQAAKAYSKEIVRVYDLLKKDLPAPQRTALEKSQKAWLNYLDAQRLVVSYIYDAPGTIHRIEGMAALMGVLQHRLEDICDFFIARDENGGPSEEVPGEDYWCGETHHRLPGTDPLKGLVGDRSAPKQK